MLPAPHLISCSVYHVQFRYIYCTKHVCHTKHDQSYLIYPQQAISLLTEMLPLKAEAYGEGHLQVVMAVYPSLAQLVY